MARALDMTGSTGRHYHFKELIQEREDFGRVWLATTGSGQDHNILKDVPKNIFTNSKENVQPRLPHSPHIRGPVDHIPQENILVYKYLTDDFYFLIKKQINVRVKRRILKAAFKELPNYILKTSFILIPSLTTFWSTTDTIHRNR
ncbi:hypothetical protein AAFC00_002281 [Neodothiora populina]